MSAVLSEAAEEFAERDNSVDRCWQPSGGESPIPALSHRPAAIVIAGWLNCAGQEKSLDCSDEFIGKDGICDVN
jgi:hypothetical protein